MGIFSESLFASFYLSKIVMSAKKRCKMSQTIEEERELSSSRGSQSFRKGKSFCSRSVCALILKTGFRVNRKFLQVPSLLYTNNVDEIGSPLVCQLYFARQQQHVLCQRIQWLIISECGSAHGFYLSSLYLLNMACFSFVFSYLFSLFCMVILLRFFKEKGIQHLKKTKKKDA